VNIFFVDADPREAARQLPNAHVIKMILESCQLLCTTLREYGVEAPYAATHARHPSRLWVAESAANYLWLVEHTDGLLAEYQRRYGMHKVHKSTAALEFCRAAGPPMADVGLTPFKLAMPDDLKVAHQGCGIATYQRYLRVHKKQLIDKTIESHRAEAPEWFLLSAEEFDERERKMVSDVCAQMHGGLCVPKIQSCDPRAV